MNRSEILDFVNKNPVFFLATTEGTQPRVRGMMVCRADEKGILFNTGKMKDLHKQLSANPSVELCFYSMTENRQLRITGSVELIEDMETKQIVLEKLPFLKPWVEAEGYDGMAPYRLSKGKATVWTMETNFNPKEIFDF